MHEVIEGIEDGNETVLINLDHSKTFDKVHLRFLDGILETAVFEPEFRRWINVLYQSLTAVVQLNEKPSGSFAIIWSVQQGCSLSTLLYTLALKPQLCSLRDERTCTVLRGISLVGCLEDKVSASVDDITVFVLSISKISGLEKTLSHP